MAGRIAALIAALTLTLSIGGLTAARAAADDYTWAGAATGANSGDWSNTINWAGGVAPSGTVGTLDFPQLTSAACTGSSYEAACYDSVDDITGISANALSVDDSQPYDISGSISLGAGGLTAAPDSNRR